MLLAAGRPPALGAADTHRLPGPARLPASSRARDFLHLLVEREFIAGFLEGKWSSLSRSWWARGQTEPQTSPVSYLLGVETLILRLMGKSHI